MRPDDDANHHSAPRLACPDAVAIPGPPDAQHDTGVQLAQQSQALALLHATLEASPDGVSAVSVGGKLIAFNRNFARIWGIPADMLERRSPEELWTHCTRQIKHPVPRTIGAALGSPTVREEYLLHDGRTLERHISPQITAGEHQAVVLQWRDITERKRAEVQRHRMARILERSLNEIYLFDQHTLRFVYANAGALANLGYTLDQLTQLTPLDLQAEPDEPGFRRRLQSLVDGDTELLIFETAKLRADGSRYDAQVHLQCDAQDEHPVFMALVLDITERKRTEKQLQETQSFMSTLLEVTPASIFVTAADHRLRLVNRQWERDTQTPRAQAIGRLMEEVFPSALAHTYAADNQQVVDTGGQLVTERWVDTPLGRRCYYTIKFPLHNAQGQIETVGGISIDITDHKNAEAQVKNLAFSDQLTGLPNRRLLLDRLDKTMATCLRHQHYGALLFVDLDNFKTLNDTYGHEMGDLLLQQVGLRLVDCVRDSDTVARLGGDEFVVMLSDLSACPDEAAQQAQAVGEKILALLNQAYQLANTKYHVTPSIGITLFGTQHESLEEPLKRADMAMYQAKAVGRNTLCFFDPDMQAVANARSALEMGLREALANSEFRLHYQPQMYGTQQVTGVEALVRWLHPQRGMVSPAEFIPLAEESGLILPLGLWVLHAACAQLALWAASPSTAQLTVSVNVSPRQFKQADFVDQVLTVLAHTGASPQRLKLELTESMLVSSIDDVVAKMLALKQVGVGFSLDDFGTGYSSLSHLKRLPLEQLKIDQSFVKDLLTDANDAAIARMVIALADSLGIAAIAEGVESHAQREFLASQGCHAYQGYLFSRPLPLEEFENWLQQAR